MKKFYSFKDIKKKLRKSDTVIVKFLILPVASRIAYIFINYTNIRPATISLIGLILGFLSAYFFYHQEIYVAILLYFTAITFDFVDGLVARVKKIESVLGIVFDTYFDFIILLVNIFALILINNHNIIIVGLLLSYLLIHFIESWIDFGIFSIFKFYNKKKIIKLNSLDVFFYNLKKYLERYNLRTIFFYYQERYFCIFIISPLLNFKINFMLFIIIMTVIMINLKVLFDISMIKISFKKKVNHSFKFRKEINK